MPRNCAICGGYLYNTRRKTCGTKCAFELGIRTSKQGKEKKEARVIMEKPKFVNDTGFFDWREYAGNIIV